MNARALMRRRGRLQFWVAVGVAVLLLAVYVAVYELQPFATDFWNNVPLDSLNALAAGLSALFATLVWRNYEADDSPRRVWRWYAVALWLWTAAEIIWAVYHAALNFGDVPTTWADLFWVIAYGFFGAALYAQYNLLLRFKAGSWLRRIAWPVIGALGLTALLTWLLNYFAMKPLSLDSVVNSFYPAGDLVLGLAAVWLVRRFQGGALGFTWLGLLVFALADLLYAWLNLTNTYTLDNPLSTVSDISYLVAYLIIALGCFMHWSLLHYGPIFRREARVPQS